MAVRQQELRSPLGGGQEATVYLFPTRRVRAAAAHRRMIARRRRTLGALAAAAVVVMGVMAGGSGSVAPASTHETPRSVVVRAEDTLWEIAVRHAPEATDSRAYLDAVVELNDIVGAVQEGQRIRLPR